MSCLCLGVRLGGAGVFVVVGADPTCVRIRALIWKTLPLPQGEESALRPERILMPMGKISP
jgi:hypothetical protein